MVNINKIKKRLEDDYTHIKTFITGRPEEPVFFACNYDDPTFVIVSVYLDSEIGGHYTLDQAGYMEFVYNDFDAAQAEDLRDAIIEEIKNGTATVLGDIKPEQLH